MHGSKSPRVFRRGLFAARPAASVTSLERPFTMRSYKSRSASPRRVGPLPAGPAARYLAVRRCASLGGCVWLLAEATQTSPCVPFARCDLRVLAGCENLCSLQVKAYGSRSARRRAQHCMCFAGTTPETKTSTTASELSPQCWHGEVRAALKLPNSGRILVVCTEHAEVRQR